MFESEAHESHSSCAASSKPPTSSCWVVKRLFLTLALNNSSISMKNLIFSRSYEISKRFSLLSVVYSIACVHLFLHHHPLVCKIWNDLWVEGEWNLNSNSVSLVCTTWNLKLCLSFLFLYIILYYQTFRKKITLILCALMCVVTVKTATATAISMDQHIIGVRATPLVAVRRRMRHPIPVH